MGIFGKLFKGPEIDQAKSADSKQKMRRLFDSVVPDGGQYQLVAAYTEDAKRFNYGLVHGSKTTYGSLIVGWKEGADPTVVVSPYDRTKKIKILNRGTNKPYPSGTVLRDTNFPNEIKKFRVP